MSFSFMRFLRGLPPLTAGLHLRLLAAPFLLSLADATATLRCQPDEYWNGFGERHLIEANPFVRIALAIHPLMLIPGFIGWYVIVFLLMFRTPAWVGLRVHVLLVFGHLVAVSGACLRFSEHPVLRILLLLSLAIPPAVLLFRPFRPQWNSRQRLTAPSLVPAGTER